jgi:hypothetical protein
MHIQLGKLRETASQQIIEKINSLPMGEVSPDSVVAIIHAIENCIGCSKTANEITGLVLKSSNVDSTIQKIFSDDLQMSDYFFPDEKMHHLIQSLDRRIPT